MAGPDGHTPVDLTAPVPGGLPQAAERFSLFALLRLLERLDTARPRFGEARRPADELARLSQPPHMNFAPTEVAAIRAGPAGRWQVEQLGFGVFGPNGALPFHLTEYAFTRSRHHQDPAVADFVNLFQHRLVELFYRGWAESDPVASHARPDADRFRGFLGALFGLHAPGAGDRDDVHDCAKLGRTGLFAPGPKSAESLETILADFFRLPVRIREFVPGWLVIPADEYTRLGAGEGSAVLGRTATLGASSWQCQDRFEVRVGPLSFEQFLQFLPGSRAQRSLAALVRFFTTDEWSWQVRLLVRAGDAPGIRLGDVGRLGWTSWLGQKRGVADDVVLYA